MGHLARQHQFLEQLIDYQTRNFLNEEQTDALYRDINAFLKAPGASDYVLETITVRIVRLGVDYESYVSALIFKTLPDEFTKRELVKLEEEFYSYIEKELYGKGLDKRITAKLIAQICRQNPQLDKTLAEKKALGNWGWLLPHSLTQLVIDQIVELMEQSKIEASKGKKKGRKIRIKKMD